VLAPRDEVVRRAARTLADGERLDTTVLAAQLGISRVTLFRRVGNRDAILGEAVWWLGERTLQRVVRAHDARPVGAEPAGRLRSLATSRTTATCWAPRRGCGASSTTSPPPRCGSSPTRTAGCSRGSRRPAPGRPGTTSRSAG
jgi:hypothetical protein